MVVPPVIAFQAAIVPTMPPSVHLGSIIQEIDFNLPMQLFLSTMQMLALSPVRIFQR